MAIVSQGNSVVLDVDSTSAIWVKSTGNAEVTVNRGGTPEVSNVTTDVGRFGYYGEPFQLTIRSVTGQAEYQDQQFSVQPLTSTQMGGLADSSATDVALAVNGIINASKNRRAACMGVSFMAQQTQNGPTNFIFRDIGYLTHLFALMGWPWRWEIASNFAVGGALTSAIITDQLPNVLASHKSDPIDTMFIAMGTNDTAQSIPYATIISNMDAIITALTDVGINVVLETIPPRGVDVSLLAYKQVSMNINRWLARQELAGRITLVDITQVMADVTTSFGNALPALTYDPSSALHPNTLGAKLIGKAFFDKLSKFGYKPTITYATQPADTYDATNNPTGSIFSNPTLQGGTTAPTGYTTSGGVWAGSNVTLPNGQLKRIWSVPLVASTTHFMYRDVVRNGSGWQPADNIQSGDKLEGRCRVTVTGATGLRSVRFYIQESDGAVSRTYQCLSNSTTNELNSMDGTYTYDLKTPICTVRPYAGSGNVSVFIRCEFITEASGVAGSATIEAFELRKVID